MTLSAAEQFLLELINRARLDPVAEAARIGIDLNEGLSPGTIDGAAKQVLVANGSLETAALLHTQYMLAADVFSHTGAGGTDPGDRITAQHYDWTTYGENIAYVGSTGTVTVEGSIAQLYTNLFHSEHHRTNTLEGRFAEAGLSAEVGQFKQGATTFNVAMLTENFATRGPQHFLTGVAYADGNDNRFYGIGEGSAGVVFQVGAAQATTSAAGGYGLQVASRANLAVTGHQGALDFALTVNTRPGNVKLDLVNGDTFHASGSVVLGTGVQDLVLLGVARLNGTGTAAANDLTGNRGNNVLTGLAGADVLNGAAGKDRLLGGGGNDVMTGGADADRFEFARGDKVDAITDFSVAAGDILQLDDALWGQQLLTAAEVVARFGQMVGGHAVLDFARGDHIDLLGVTSLTGLSAAIDIV